MTDNSYINWFISIRNQFIFFQWLERCEKLNTLKIWNYLKFDIFQGVTLSYKCLQWVHPQMRSTKPKTSSVFCPKTRVASLDSHLSLCWALVQQEVALHFQSLKIWTEASSSHKIKDPVQTKHGTLEMLLVWFKVVWRKKYLRDIASWGTILSLIFWLADPCRLKAWTFGGWGLSARSQSSAPEMTILGTSPFCDIQESIK